MTQLAFQATITLSELESHLWESANILRGPVDATDFKTYVFPLLFFKRISDVHDEEYEAALAESGGDEEYAVFPQNYRFQIPADCHWSDVRTITTNVGQALQKALRGIEKANPETLYGIFGDAQWTNKDRLSDALLRDLIEHFSRINLGNRAAEADILGQSYEYLIRKFADLTNKKAGEFYTPRSVVKLMVNILDPKEGQSVYDPACGTGGMLMEAIHHVRENHGDDRTLWGKLFGQEKNLPGFRFRVSVFVESHKPIGKRVRPWLSSPHRPATKRKSEADGINWPCSDCGCAGFQNGCSVAVSSFGFLVSDFFQQ